MCPSTFVCGVHDFIEAAERSWRLLSQSSLLLCTVWFAPDQKRDTSY